MSYKAVTLILFISINLSYCNYKKSHNYISLPINQEKAHNLFRDQKQIIVLTCISCSCFKQAIDAGQKKDSSFWNRLNIFCDSSCVKLQIPNSIHIDQKALDSVSEDLYNMVLFREVKGNYEVMIIDSKNNNNLKNIIKEFFEH